MRLIERLQNRLLGYRSTRNFATHTPDTVALSRDSGFFSNCSVLLMILARSDKHPVEIDVSESFTHFAERELIPVERLLSATSPCDPWQSSAVAEQPSRQTSPSPFGIQAP